MKRYNWKPIKAPERINVEIRQFGIDTFSQSQRAKLDRDEVLDIAVDRMIEDVRDRNPGIDFDNPPVIWNGGQG